MEKQVKIIPEGFCLRITYVNFTKSFLQKPNGWLMM